MRLALERHAYAPELNAAHIIRKGRVVAILPVPGARSIREARKALFPPYVARRYIKATKARPAPWDGLNRSVSAAYPLAPGVLAKAIADVRTCERQPGTLRAESAAVLDDGRELPASRTLIETRLAYVPQRESI
jgi:hypothetical protein